MNHFALFGKYWQAGTVKTRLARTLGAEQASQLYRVFLATLLCRYAEIGDRRSLVYTPSDATAAFRELAGARWALLPQCEGDLGERMQAFFDQAFAQGAHRVVLLGSDSPSLPVRHVIKAFAQLEHHRVVLGPSTDGGFYLIGAAGAMPNVLRGIRWSTSDVLACTTDRFEQAGARCHHLSPWYDIDEREHLEQLDRELSEQTNLSGALQRLAQAVRQTLAHCEPP